MHLLQLGLLQLLDAHDSLAGHTEHARGSHLGFCLANVFSRQSSTAPGLVHFVSQIIIPLVWYIGLIGDVVLGG